MIYMHEVERLYSVMKMLPPYQLNQWHTKSADVLKSEIKFGTIPRPDIIN